MKNSDYIERFLSETKDTIDRMIDEEGENIDAAIEILYEAWKNGKRVFVFGNGGSASNASHFTCDIAKCTIVPGKPRISAMCLNENAGLFTAHVNDDGWENVYVEQLMNNLKSGDVVIALSVHGGSGRDKAGAWSQNLLKAIDYANNNGARTIGLSGFDGGALRTLAHVCITVPKNSTPHVEPLHTLVHHLICDRLRERIAGPATREISGASFGRAVFLDRDGVINRINYDDDLGLCTPHTADEFTFLPKVPESVKRLNSMKLATVLVSNQPDVSKGRLSTKNHEKINERMISGLRENGARLDAVYYCLHRSEDNCDCRKPQPGMLLRAAKIHGIDMGRSYIIGDSLADVEAGRAAGCKTILIANPRLDILNIIKDRGVEPDYIVKDLAAAVDLIEKTESSIIETEEI